MEPVLVSFVRCFGHANKTLYTFSLVFLIHHSRRKFPSSAATFIIFASRKPRLTPICNSNEVCPDSFSFRLSAALLVWSICAWNAVFLQGLDILKEIIRQFFDIFCDSTLTLSLDESECSICASCRFDNRARKFRFQLGIWSPLFVTMDQECVLNGNSTAISIGATVSRSALICCQTLMQLVWHCEYLARVEYQHHSKLASLGVLNGSWAIAVFLDNEKAAEPLHKV